MLNKFKYTDKEMNQRIYSGYYAKKDKRIIYVEKQNEGTGKTRNLGIKMATGTYLTFLDSDDWVTEDYIEKLHEERYRALLKNVETAQVFEKSEIKVWECRNCGHIMVGPTAPEVCPTCDHPQSYFELRKVNY